MSDSAENRTMKGVFITHKHLYEIELFSKVHLSYFYSITILVRRVTHF